MLVNTSTTIVYKCSSCGAYEFFNVSLFSLFEKRELQMRCKCNGCSALICRENSVEYRIKIPCIGCGNDHIFVLGRKEMFYKGVKVFHCPQTGIPQCLIGDDEEVRKKIDNIEKELDELIDAFGYESCFKNTRVMFDSLNKIHDIAEQGNLFCECGNKSVDLVMLSDRIQLKCTKCSGSETIFAVSNEDLKDTMSKRYIILNSEKDNYKKTDEGK